MKKNAKIIAAWVVAAMVSVCAVSVSHAQDSSSDAQILESEITETSEREDTDEVQVTPENPVDNSISQEEKSETEIQTEIEEKKEDDTDSSKSVENVQAESKICPELSYRTHVQNIGWQNWKKSGETAGTTGQSKRLEAIELKISNCDYEGSIEYQTHIQNIGWQSWRRNGQMSGTEAQALRLEAVKIRLTGELEKQFDIYYRVHIQNYGWLPYVKNGEAAGSEEFGLRLEGLEVCLVKKDEGQTINTGQGFLKNILYYSGHIQTSGNTAEVKSGNVLGTVGMKRRMEAISLKLKNTEGYVSGSVSYRTHIQDLGWQDWKKNGQMSGTSGQSRRLEAVQIKLEGEIYQIYDIYYRVHVQNYGWLGWAKNGEEAGTSGHAYRMEAIQIQLVPKGQKAPGSTVHPYIKKYTQDKLTYSGHIQNVGDTESVKGGMTLGTVGKGYRLEGLSINLNDSDNGLVKGSIQYRVHVQDIGWQGWKQEGEFAGTTGQRKSLEAVQIRLTGEIAEYYHVYYRAHSQYFGWLGWAKDGESAGTSSLSVRLEAIQVLLVPKMDNQAAYQTGKAYYDTYRYQNPKQYLQIRHVQKTLSGGGYNLSSGYMGLKVWYVQRKLGLSGRRAIMDSTTINAVKSYQRKNGLPVTGVVNLQTWKKMGYSESAWYQLGAYASPLKTNPSSTRQDCIEAMISTAYRYLGNPYIIGASGDTAHGLDCSGLVMQALYSAGIDPAPVSPIRHSMPGYEYECRNLWNLPMKHVSYSQRQRGDLIFYKSANGTIIHVAIYLGNNMVIESWPNKVVVWPVQNSHRSLIAGVARPFV